MYDVCDIHDQFMIGLNPIAELRCEDVTAASQRLIWYLDT